MFTTWICLLSKELRQMFPFPSRERVSQWMPRRFKKHFPHAKVIIDCYELECQRPSGLLNSSITYRIAGMFGGINVWRIGQIKSIWQKKFGE